MSIELGDYFGHNSISRDFMEAIVGQKLGGGSYRYVYEHKQRPDLAIKIEIFNSCRFCNVIEWSIWESVKDRKNIACWLAPCVSISPCGVILMMKRTSVIPPDKLPKKIPAFLTDLKRANWGLLGKQPVVHDYANNLVFENIKPTLKRANWWSKT